MEDSFGEWFSRVIREAEIMDPRYPVKGLCVWLPYGMKLRNLVISIIRRLLEERGHHEVLFPLLIPEDAFNREAEHIRGFENEVYWVTRGGGEELDVKLVLRPTSETSMYPMFALWVRSHADLPIKVFQVVSVFRHETKMTKPMIRVREVTTFKEAHTAHSTREEAEAQVREAVEIYRKFFDELGIPYVITKRPEWDTFAGAEYSIAFDTLLPDGKTLQIGTVHNLGQNFSKVFGIEFQKPDGGHDHVYQTCYGISERVIAAAIVVHGDELGPCLPPKVAPIQVVIVPIVFKDEREPTELSHALLQELERGGIRAHLDLRNLRPGNKFYYWERRGVPIRIEVGPKEARWRKVTAVRRDTRKRIEIPIEELLDKIKTLLVEMEVEMKKRAWDKLNERVRKVGKLDDFEKITGGIAKMSLCGGGCAREAEERTGFKILGEELDSKPSGRCAVCGRAAERTVLMARSY